MTGILNQYIDAIMTGIFWLVVFLFALKYSLERLREDGLGQSIYLSIINIFQLVLAAGIFWGLPYLLEKYLPNMELAGWARWVEILAVGNLIFRRRKHAGSRGLNSFHWHYALLLFAWIIDRWVGILVIALPLLAVYYITMSRIASEIMPASDPEDKKERRARHRVFLSYVWGLQQPLWKSPSHTASEAEKRIDGAPASIKFESLVWTYPNQVLGIAEGPKFSVDGPGLIFIDKGKQPFDIVDLRDQSCFSKIKAISRDGISFEAKVTVSFRVDREPWTKDQHQDLRRENTMLRDARELDKNLLGAFPYSFARVKSVLSYRRKKPTVAGEETERWITHVMSVAEEAAREALAERSIEDLWKARENESSSAAEEITSEIKNAINRTLRKNGIFLITAKATEFSFKEAGFDKADDEKEKDVVSDQQLATWSVEWERQRAMTLADGQAESERYQQEARAYAHSILLTAIAEGLQQARAIHPNLPRYVIAMRFIGALEEMIEQQPEAEGKTQASTTVSKLKAHLLSNPPGE